MLERLKTVVNTNTLKRNSILFRPGLYSNGARLMPCEDVRMIYNEQMDCFYVRL